MSKGLTPIIAMILLLMMTVAAAGTSFYWLIRIQGELQGGTQQFQEQTFERMTSHVAWQDADYNNTTGILLLTILNTGTTKIPINNQTASPNVQWTLLDSELDIICTSNWNSTNVNCTAGCDATGDLALKELRLLNLTLQGTCNTSTQPLDSLIYAKITFSGKTTTSGTFRVEN